MLSDHRYTAIFGAALLTASGATFAVYRLIGTASKPQREPVRTVVVAVRDVPVGVPVPREALGLAAWPVRVAPSESFVNADSIIGRITRAPLISGDPVLPSRLAVRGAAPGLEGAIDPTRRAMAVRVNEAASVSGLVRSNSRVDVLMAARSDGTQPARLLMTDVRVLGVGSVRPPEAPAGGGDPAPAASSAASSAVVTLEVTPTQAAELAAAESQGAIQVVLRGYGSANDPRGAESVIPYPGPIAPGAPRYGASSAAAPGGWGEGGPALAGASRVALASAVGPVAAPRPRRTSASQAASAPSERAPRHGSSGERAAYSSPESTTVYLYRGGTMTVLRMGATGPVPNAPVAATAGPPAGPPADEARDGGLRAIRTADARVGPHAP